jgi:glycosyltransferase involved in cell wall biosynthesis
MRVLIFPNDPLAAYLKKGELKDRYFNPNNIFDEVHFVTFFDEECAIEDIQKTIGSAKGYIHKLSPISILDMFFPKRRVNDIINEISSIKVDIVRAYNPIFQGFFAGIASLQLKVPFLISLHGNYDLDIRYQYKINRDKRYLKYLLSKYSVEPKSLQMATHILGAYKFAGKYATDNGVDQSKVSIIYNRVYLNRFKPNPNKKISTKIRVICVGRLIKEKGQRILVDAMATLSKNISLTIVGDGEDYDLLVAKSKALNLLDRVTFIRSVPNEKLADLYREHHIFALPIQYGGICIPVLEATASGLALVMPKPIHEDAPEIIQDYAEVVENSAKGFAVGIRKVANDSKLREKMVNKGFTVIKDYSGDIMEEKESELYKKLVDANENI